MLTKKEKGYLSESLVSDYFSDQGFLLLAKNYTIKGGELDLVFKSETSWLFIEVKDIDGLDDIYDHISAKKLQALQRTIKYFFQEHDQGDLDQQIVVVYTKAKQIYQLYYHEN